MKKMIYLLLIFNSLLIACGGGESAKNKTPKTLDEARKQLKEKTAELKEIELEVTKLKTLVEKLDTTAKKDKKVQVLAQKVPTKTFEHFVEVQGNVMPANDPAFASSETGGRILDLRVKENDYVKEGDTIAIVDLESVRKSIAEIDKSLELARDMYERQKNLWEKKIGSEVQYLQAKNQVESLEKTKERLEFELSKANVFAPASGYVDQVMTKEGEVAGPGTPIIQILNTNALKVVAAVPENYLGAIKRGETIRVNFPAIEQEQNAQVSMIGRTINPSNRTFEVEASIRGRSDLIKPNLLATIFINDYTKKDAVVVPDEYILQDVSGKNYVMVNEGNKATRRVVQLGENYNNETVIVSGLSGNEMLITRGARSVNEGDNIEIIKSDSPAIVSEK